MTTPRLVLRIEPDGTVVGLSGSGIEEALNLRALGPMTVERAGHIRFDDASQTWGWYSADGKLGRGGFKTRREAVTDETATLAETL
jgi:hypothetical protein